jgi:hypothetical protein
MKSQVDKSKRNLNPTVAKEEEEQSRRPLITFQETWVVLEGAKRGPSWQSCKNVKFFLAFYSKRLYCSGALINYEARVLLAMLGLPCLRHLHFYELSPAVKNS